MTALAPLRSVSPTRTPRPRKLAINRSDGRQAWDDEVARQLRPSDIDEACMRFSILGHTVTQVRTFENGTVLINVTSPSGFRTLTTEMPVYPHPDPQPVTPAITQMDDNAAHMREHDPHWADYIPPAPERPQRRRRGVRKGKERAPLPLR